jgi:hypothetical protein
MRTVVFFLALTGSVLPAMAQAPAPAAAQRMAWDYAYGVNPSVPAIRLGPSAGEGAIQTVSVERYLTAADGVRFEPISRKAPMRIGADTVFPLSVSCSTTGASGTCAIRAAFPRRYSDGVLLTSATAGLQEAINAAAAAGGGKVVADAAWARGGGTDAMLAGADVPAGVSVIDIRTGVSADSVSVRQSAVGAVSENLSEVLNQAVRVTGFSGVDFCERLNKALRSLPAEGGTVDARGFRTEQQCSVDPFSGVKSLSAVILLPAAKIVSSVNWHAILPQRLALIGVQRYDSSGAPRGSVIQFARSVTGVAFELTDSKQSRIEDVTFDFQQPGPQSALTKGLLVNGFTLFSAKRLSLQNLSPQEAAGAGPTIPIFELNSAGDPAGLGYGGIDASLEQIDARYGLVRYMGDPRSVQRVMMVNAANLSAQFMQQVRVGVTTCTNCYFQPVVEITDGTPYDTVVLNDAEQATFIGADIEGKMPHANFQLAPWVDGHLTSATTKTGIQTVEYCQTDAIAVAPFAPPLVGTYVVVLNPSGTYPGAARTLKPAASSSALPQWKGPALPAPVSVESGGASIRLPPTFPKSTLRTLSYSPGRSGTSPPSVGRLTTTERRCAHTAQRPSGSSPWIRAP